MEELQNYTHTLEDIIEAAKKFTNGEWTQEQMGEYGNSFNIRAYIPLLEKTTVVACILNKYLFDDKGIAAFSIADMEKDLFYYGLLQKYGMIDCSDNTLTTYENYDLLYPIFSNFIMQFCKEDYRIFSNLFYNSINLSNIRQTLQMLQRLDSKAIQKTAENNQKFYTELKNNKELIDKLNNIAIMNNPTVAAVLQELQKEQFDSQIKK